MKNRKVGIVVLNYKNYEDTIECLRSLAKISYLNTEIIVVDNNSLNDSLKYIQKDLILRQVSHKVIGESVIDSSNQFFEKVFLLKSNSNRGYAAGNNLGIRVALKRGVDYIMILNNDVVVDEKFLEPLVQYAESNTVVGLVGPKILDLNGDIDSTCVRRRFTLKDMFFQEGIGKRLFPNNKYSLRHTYKSEYNFDHPKEVDVLSGCCMMFKSCVFKKIGLLDENTFLFAEEFILHEKLRIAGLSSVVVPNSVIVHKHGGSMAKVSSYDSINALRRSFIYYLRFYRNYSSLEVALIMVLFWTPRKIFEFIKR